MYLIYIIAVVWWCCHCNFSYITVHVVYAVTPRVSQTALFRVAELLSGENVMNCVKCVAC